MVGPLFPTTRAGGDLGASPAAPRLAVLGGGHGPRKHGRTTGGGARVEVWEADGRASTTSSTTTGGPADEPTCSPTTTGGFRLGSVTPTPSAGSRTTVRSARSFVATGRDRCAPPTPHVMVTAPGYRDLVTHVFVEGARSARDSVRCAPVPSGRSRCTPPRTRRRTARPRPRLGEHRSTWRSRADPRVVDRGPRGGEGGWPERVGFGDRQTTIHHSAGQSLTTRATRAHLFA